MAKYNVTCVTREGFLHTAAFYEVIDSTSWALSALGHEVSVTRNWFSEVGETNIIFGAELIDTARIPANSIVYNLEQPTHPNMHHIRRLVKESGCGVWDYSLRSVKEWREAGHENVRHVPIGYTPNLSRIHNGVNPDIDVLFLGWLTERRRALIEELKKLGLNVYASDSCYGGGRDNLISRSKVCLNVHHDGRDRFEIVRCSYLMANAKCVVSETSSDDDEYQDLLGLTRAPYRLLADTCHSLVKAETERWNLQSQAMESIQKRDFVKAVEAALDTPSGGVLDTYMDQRLAPIAESRVVAKRNYIREAREIQPEPDPRVTARYKMAISSGDMKDFASWLSIRAKGNIVEIGVRDGASTSAFLFGLQANGGHLWSIDTDPCGKLFEGHPQWSFLQCDSKDRAAVLGFIPYQIDILLIDGDHSRAGVINDIEYARQLRPGGMVIFHDIAPEDKPSGCQDYSWPSDDVKNVYEELCANMAPMGWTHEEIPGRYGMGVLRKPAAVPAKLPTALEEYPHLPENMTMGKSPEEVEEMKGVIRGHTLKQVGMAEAHAKHMQDIQDFGRDMSEQKLGAK